ncbi:hypothetical protein AVI51_15535 (plasmid) [Piscirickettsia salmonis]|uniref:hypothetical protein n=1 Tax=Piscirickettsia salmonis TaxID=1238 RepID=UPI00094A5369|nr:hypothetical protein [Piscirickettsia salmonis]APS46078.1 hypothetical protein AVI48_16825 [Piscirickettsia salmonis]APS49161.1 hypothetical protein AVI49_16040 [Piscirickettsia salmonis]APS52382.1 hypothetical protein AVI50_16095 [Piscirickettsia salmonis]APS55534.1 hypothetical protein AVI51_15535 [Piscirickettsia salmonis]QGO82250.1 hypothetical protein Psal107_03300 [Piscirickettsia salmonis]
MDNQAPHIRDVLNSLQQITGQAWREVEDKATMCLAFNTDLTDHAVLPTEQSMWPVRTRFVAPVAHDQEGCHKSWWSVTKHFFHVVEKNGVSAVHSVNDFISNHHAEILVATGIIFVAATPFGWLALGVSEAVEGTAILTDALVSIRSAEIGETLGSQSRNIFYGLKKYAAGSIKMATVGAGFTSTLVGNWEKNSGESFFFRAVDTAQGTATDLGLGGTLKTLGVGAKTLVVTRSWQAAKADIIDSTAKLTKVKGIMDYYAKTRGVGL